MTQKVFAQLPQSDMSHQPRCSFHSECCLFLTTFVSFLHLKGFLLNVLIGV